jgi:hypothetical protein
MALVPKAPSEITPPARRETMQEHTNKKRSRAAKLLGGALVGTVLSIGAVADSASAWTKVSASTTVEEGGSTAQPSFARMSGIRW